MEWILLVGAVLLVLVVGGVALWNAARRRINRESPTGRALLKAAQASTVGGSYVQKFDGALESMASATDDLAPRLANATYATTVSRGRSFPAPAYAAWVTASLLPTEAVRAVVSALGARQTLVAATLFDDVFPGIKRVNVPDGPIHNKVHVLAIATGLLIDWGTEVGILEEGEAFTAPAP